MIKLTVGVALLGLIIGFTRTEWMRRTLNSRWGIKVSEPLLFSGCVLVVFILFTTLGLTGSSLNAGLRLTPFVDTDMTQIMGHEQPIRSDEWLVLTPLAIAQHNHVPDYPVVNTAIGLDGHNMLIAGMTGLPVAHLSALGKPATWGFFVLDLKRALAWYWWFAPFGCLLAVAHLLNVLAPGRWRQSFLFALLFTCAPYVVAWSFWPAYAVFFPCVALLCLLKILQPRTTWHVLPLGVFAGMAIAGFVLVLYPPWQVTVGCVFVALLVGVGIRDRLYRNVTLAPALAILLALLVAAALLGNWWLSAQEAIHAMMHTVYPGQRNIEVGGNLSWHALFKGYTNLMALRYVEGVPVNQSEIASFHYYFLPLFALFFIRARQRDLTAVDMALAVMIIVILIYMLAGFGRTLSIYSLWSYVTAKRADLALGLASLMLTHSLIRPGKIAVKSERRTLVAWIVALVWAAWVYSGLQSFDGPTLSGFTPAITFGLIVATVASGYFLLTCRPRAFLVVNLGMTLAATLSFHPLSVAPTQIRMSNIPPTDPVLTLGSQIPAMMLAATGQTVVNGVFYYPQTTLWRQLDPEGVHTRQYNRYQHLIFISQTALDHVRIEVPQPDVVKVFVNPQRQDFNTTSARWLVAPAGESLLLKQNSTLSLERSEKGWSWFKVNAAP